MWPKKRVIGLAVSATGDLLEICLSDDVLLISKERNHEQPHF
jgi:hypothetical protein